MGRNGLAKAAGAAVLVAAGWLPVAAVAQHSGHGGHGAAPAAGAVASAQASGEVRKVDKTAVKVTLKHGEIPSLDMPAMTMAFQVADASMLERVKAGDKVRFVLERRGDALLVRSIEPAK